MRLSKIQLAIIALFILAITSSCEKGVAPKDPEEILTGSIWQVEELRYLKNNLQYYYKRGSLDSNIDYDNEYIKFNKDKTGTLYGKLPPAPVTWAFANADKTAIRFKVQFQGVAPVYVTWENVIYDESLIRYTEYYIQDGIETLGAGIRTPRR